MRVLALSNLYPPNAMGGYEMSCRDVVDRWRDRGHDVSVLTTGTRVGGVVEPDTETPHVRRTLEWYWREHAFLRPSPLARLRLERHNQVRLRAALTAHRPDVVSVWHMGGMSLSLLTTLADASVPTVLNVCDDWPDYAPRTDAWLDAWSRRPRWQRGLGAAMLRTPTDVPDLDRHASTFVSRFTLERARARTGFAFSDAVVVGSGVDTCDFPLQEQPEDRPWGWKLLCVGRVEPRKGFDTAVRALARLPEATLDIVGVADPDYQRELLDLAASLGVTPRLRLRAMPRAQLSAIYRDADVVLFTSRWDEPFGLVPLEAMSQRTPVVATRRGGSAEFLVDAVNCLEMRVDDDADLAQQVVRLSGDVGLRQRLAVAGIDTVRRYTTDALASRLEQVHLSAAGLD